MGSREGAAKARATFLARVRSGEIVVTGKPAGHVLPFVPLQRVYLSPVTLAGRVAIVLDLHGPLTVAELARRCEVTVDELEDVAPLLRAHAEALLVGDELLVYGRRESWAAIWEARARLLAREEVCRVAA